MKSIISIVIFIIFCNNLFSSELLFKPLVANPLEARVGTIFQVNNDKLRLDIGNSFDLMEVYKDSSEIRIGGDFMTYTRIRSEGRMVFDVETTDYYFGLNTSFRTTIFCKEFYGRVRLAHISSHIIDGYYNGETLTVEPYTYSREFVDIVLAVPIDDIRLYFGGNIIFSTIPDEVNLFEPQLGFDYNRPIYDNFNLVLGVDYKLLGQNDEYNETVSIEAGIFYKTQGKMGLMLSYNYYNGQSMHGMFIRERDVYNGIGLKINFWE